MRTRFAPSPTGRLHLGHAFSALTAWDLTCAAGGEFRLRIEDIDRSRSRPEYEAAIYEDLAWLGLRWPEPVLRQSERMPAYRAALDRLRAMGLIYACTCTRRDIQAALSAPQEGTGPDGPAYPGTCRAKNRPEAGAAHRLDMARAIAALGGPAAVARISCEETGPDFAGFRQLEPCRLEYEIGDVVLARKDLGTSYHLAVVVDDATEAITHVVRGADLLSAVPIHRLLQALLELPVPVWHHHRLIRDDTGRRLAKRDDARSLAALRAEGATPGDIRRMLGLGDRL